MVNILASIAMVFYQIFQIKHIQSDILSLYAYVSRDTMAEVYQSCSEFMREIANGSFMR